MPRKKIKPGDWFAHAPTGVVGQVVRIDAQGWLCTGRGFFDPDLCTKLPASPATLVKSHRLLMRWYNGEMQDPKSKAYDVAFRHCRRIAKKAGKK